MDYSLRELECFTAVAEELSFTRAARRLHLSQPPLSRHIRALEEKIGAQLFIREARTVALTQAGRLFHEETRGILAQLTRAGEAARRSAHGESDRLRLGMVSAVLSARIAEILRHFREAHPSVQIALHDLSPAEQLRMIGEGHLDGGFVGLMPVEPTTHVRFDKWCKEKLLAFVPSGHVLASETEIPLADLRSEKFVAVSNEAAPAFSVFLHELCRQAGFRPRIILESPRAQAVAVMVAAGCGVAILPESLAHFAGRSIVGIPLKGAPAITHIFASAGTRPSPIMKDLLELLKHSERLAAH